jgi:hypothetical protein
MKLLYKITVNNLDFYVVAEHPIEAEQKLLDNIINNSSISISELKVSNIQLIAKTHPEDSYKDRVDFLKYLEKLVI